MTPRRVSTGNAGGFVAGFLVEGEKLLPESRAFSFSLSTYAFSAAIFSAFARSFDGADTAIDELVQPAALLDTNAAAAGGEPVLARKAERQLRLGSRERPCERGAEIVQLIRELAHDLAPDFRLSLRVDRVVKIVSGLTEAS